jgi:hypothetical protein
LRCLIVDVHREEPVQIRDHLDPTRLRGIDRRCAQLFVDGDPGYFLREGFEIVQWTGCSGC